MKKLGVAIIGPGWVAGEHVRGYCGDARTEIRAIVGMVPEDKPRAQQYMAKHGFQAEYLESVEQLCRRKDIDAVSICTINFLHYEQALACIKAGKHVFVEKPLCLTQKENRTLADAAKRAGVQTHVGHVGRFYPAIVGLKNFRDSGAIGEVFYAESDYWHEILGAWKVKRRTSGSALLMGGCHSVDMVRWMIGEEHEAVEVSAMSVAPRWRKDFDFDPTLSLMAKFSNGAVGRVSCSLECNMPYVFHLQVNGTKGTIRNNGFYSDMFPKSQGFMHVTSTYLDDWNVAHHPFPEEVRYFVDCVANGTESMLSIPRAFKTYELVFAAELAASKGRIVKLPLKA